MFVPPFNLFLRTSIFWCFVKIIFLEKSTPKFEKMTECFFRLSTPLIRETRKNEIGRQRNFVLTQNSACFTEQQYQWEIKIIRNTHNSLKDTDYQRIFSLRFHAT